MSNISIEYHDTWDNLFINLVASISLEFLTTIRNPIPSLSLNIPSDYLVFYLF